VGAVPAERGMRRIDAVRTMYVRCAVNLHGGVP
jgi:hypothetical protein